MQRLKAVLRVIDAISLFTGKIFPYLGVALIALLCFEVFMRYVVNRPTIWSYELDGFIFGTYLLFGGAYALVTKSHINVDMFYGKLSPRKKAIMDVCTAVFFFLLVGVLFWLGGKLAWESLLERETASNSVWAPPMYPFRLMLPLAALIVLFQGIAKFIRDLYTAITGKEGVV